ncbi:hypothetical protein E4N62_44290 [Streptomyces sp. MNU76]|uniref:hypothetical protein n=1 Tax=Streptomyces sp. MNU76 TaxID=2560026 RepID=UPI001E63E179|nr:hypothetical protein [Streptomyces sp. MNU76]MCC9711623.1 hypothetical protein [Streptomyces sp. MNU76]
MVDTKAPARAAEADADYEAYEQVVQLMSKGISDGILESLRTLKDPDAFSEQVREAAAAQGVAPESVRDTEELFEKFWALANGVDMELQWRSNSGVPVRSALIAESIAPPDGQERFSIGVSAFGIGVGVSW